MKYLALLSFLLLLGCGDLSNILQFRNDIIKHDPVTITAYQYINYHEQTNRQELKAVLGVDPVRVEWCAAFVNAVLNESGTQGSESVSNHPLMARSFLDWGQSVEEPMPGDVVVLPRGNSSWQGHVGFYLNTVTINNKKYYSILGGNQNKSVSIELFPASTVLSVRRNTF